MMRLSNTPPKGAGQVKRVTKTEVLLTHIKGPGNDKFGSFMAGTAGVWNPF